MRRARRIPHRVGTKRFSLIDSLRLLTGLPRGISAFVNLEKVKDAEVILFESDNPDIKIEPDSETVHHRKGKKYQRFRLSVRCDTKGQKGTVTGVTIDKHGREVHADIAVLGVDDPPVFQPPEDIDFVSSHFAGQPARANKAVLLVNLDAFTGMPEIKFWIEDVVGSVTLEQTEEGRVQIKVNEEHVTEQRRLARVPVTFQGTGWGQHALLWASAKRRDGKVVRARCRLRFHRPSGEDKFTDFHYEDLGRNVLGDVAGNQLYINAGYALHRQIFGATEDEFNRQLETNSIAQMRAAAVLVETSVHHTATVSYFAGGAKGIQIDPADPVGSFRTYFEERRMKLEPSVVRALTPDLGTPASAEES